MGCKMKRIPTSSNEWRMFFNREIGAIGIGAMIVFIAMVLVAGIAASVLIQTSGTLETQAMKSGHETIAEISTGLAVEGIEGWNSSGSLQLLAIEIKSRAGSAVVDLSTTIVEISDTNKKNILTYNSSIFTDTADIDGNVFTTTFYPSNNATTFGIIVINDGDDSLTYSNPVINTGDHVILTINTSAIFTTLGTSVDVFGMIVPEVGYPGVISFTTPGAYTDAIVEL
jgi:flagellin FlaB